MPWLLASLLAARAGTVVVDAAVATEVRLDGQPVVRTFGPARVTLPDMAAGTRSFEVFRDGKPTRVEVIVPDQGAVRLLVGATTLTTDRPVAAPAEGGAPPRIELRAAGPGEFAVLLDGSPVAVVGPGQPLLVDSLGAGDHPLELRSPDLLTVWVRGTLSLVPADHVVINFAEGYPAEVFGREGAWRDGS